MDLKVALLTVIFAVPVLPVDASAVTLITVGLVVTLAVASFAETDPVKVTLISLVEVRSVPNP